MTPEAQRIAIAQACGWRCDLPPQYLKAFPPDGSTKTKTVPDYLNDLNAIHEAEAALSHQQRMSYVWKLEKVTDAALPGPNTQVILAEEKFQTIHATASQRSEALLKTLGLWVETEGGEG